MSPAERQAALVAQYLPVEDPQERMALLVGRGRKQAQLPETLRTEEHRVPGCTSRVWLVPERRGECCFFQLDADSVVVKGLAASICEIYNGASLAEVAAWEPTLLETLGLVQHLSPTRAHGLRQVRKMIRNFAEQELQRSPL